MKIKILFIAFLVALSFHIKGQPCMPVFISQEASCNTCCDGSAYVFMSSGCPPYTYYWSTTPVQNTSVAVNLCPGVYTVTVTDAGGPGCCGMVTASIVITPAFNGVSTYSNNIIPIAIDYVRNLITINSSEENYSIEIVDILGKRIKSFSFSSAQREFNYSDLYSGLYFVAIYQKNNLLKTVKLIKR